MARRCGEAGSAAPEGSGISRPRICHVKQLTDGTSEPEPGLEAKPALAPGKSLCSSSRHWLGSSESTLVPPKSARAPASEWHHQPFGVHHVEFRS